MTKPEPTKVYALIDFSTSALIGIYPNRLSAQVARENTAAYVDVVALQVEEVPRVRAQEDAPAS